MLKDMEMKPPSQLVLPFGQFEIGINNLLAEAKSEEEIEQLEDILFVYWDERYSEPPRSDPEE